MRSQDALWQSTKSDSKRWSSTQTRRLGVGRPQLVGHIARVVRRAVLDGATGHPTLEIDVEADGDHEMFDDAVDFVEDVTPESLRHLQSVTIRGLTEGRALVVTLRRGWGNEGA